MDSDQKLEAIKMLKRGIPQNSVAKFYGVSRQRINFICKEEGIKATPTNREKRYNKVHYIVEKAISFGILIPQPCEICGAFGIADNGRRLVDAHHDDYNKPMDVRWLCTIHHKEWHKLNTAKPFIEKVL